MSPGKGCVRLSSRCGLLRRSSQAAGGMWFCPLPTSQQSIPALLCARVSLLPDFFPAPCVFSPGSLSGKRTLYRTLAIVPCLCGMLSRDQSLRFVTWNLLGTSRKVWNRSATGGNPVRDSTGKPVARCEERIERLFQRRGFKKTINHDFFPSSRRGHTHRISWLINKDFSSRSFTNSPHLPHFHVGR